MFIIDDILLRSLGISIPPFDLIWIFETIHDLAYRELYNPEKIRDQIKENRLLYELDEISKEEYEKINAGLTHNLRLAMRARELDLEKRIDLL